MVDRFYLAILLCFLIAPLQVFSSSPRIVVTFGPNCTFSLKKFSRQVDGIVVSGSQQKIKKSIRRHNKATSNHLLLIADEFEGLPLFSEQLGYVHVHLNTSFHSSLKKLQSIIANTPTTEADLPKINPHDAGLFYDITDTISQLLTEHNITHWATCGTLLGTIRHKGLIPWDDDVDIGIFEEDVPRLLALTELLKKHGLEIAYHPKYEFWKIYPEDGEPIVGRDGATYPWKYPFVDIFPLAESDGIYTYAAPIWRDWERLRKRDHYLPEQLQPPLAQMTFGPIKIPVPHDPTHYLGRMYGKQWNEVAYVSYCHRKEKFLPKIKVDLVNKSAPPFILPAKGTQPSSVKLKNSVFKLIEEYEI